jgi:glutaconate CoA-transferase subunit A
VSAVCVVPKGATPSYAHYYDRDNRFYRTWDVIARERDTFQHWLQRHVIDTDDFATFLRVQAESDAAAKAVQA